MIDPEITADDFAKEPNCLVYRFSEKVVKEIIYHLEASNSKEQADFAYSLKKFLREAKPLKGADKESYENILNGLLPLARDNPAAGCVVSLIRQGHPFEVCLFEGLKALISENNALRKRVEDYHMHHTEPSVIIPMCNFK